YGVSDELRSQLLALLAQAEETGWMQPLPGLLPGPYGAYIHPEREARVIQWDEPLLIPGLLQTGGYTRAHAQALPGVSADEIDMRVTARQERQREWFGRRPAPELTAIITEAALRFQVGGSGVLAEQLRQLLQRSRMRHTVVRVIAFAAGAHPSMMSSFG